MKMSVLAAAFISGVVFAIGLMLSGMTNPARVFGFLNFFGTWEPSLMLVMLGAIGTNAPLTGWIRRRNAPLLQPGFSLPTSTLPWRMQLDRSLIVGAALFGVGWGLGGYCPGPALVSVPSSVFVAGAPALKFTLAMVAGMLVFSAFDRQRSRRPTPSASLCCSEGDNRGMVNNINDASSR